MNEELFEFPKQAECDQAVSALRESVDLLGSILVDLPTDAESAGTLKTVIQMLTSRVEEIRECMNTLEQKHLAAREERAIAIQASGSPQVEKKSDIDFNKLFKNLRPYVTQGGRILLKMLQDAYMLDPATWVPVSELKKAFDEWEQEDGHTETYPTCINRLYTALDMQEIELEGPKVGSVIRMRRLKRKSISSSVEDIAEKPLEDLGLEVRVRHLLFRRGIRTIDALEQLSVAELSTSGFADASLLKVRTALYGINRHLRDDKNWKP
jgi:hypothetical protein